MDEAIPKGLKTLLVEDSDHVRYFAHEVLNHLGCNVTEAPGGAHNRFDLVFSDIVMPGMSGPELAKEIRAKYGDVPVLLASGYGSKQFIPKGQREFPILRKPYSLGTLGSAIGQLLEFRPPAP